MKSLAQVHLKDIPSDVLQENNFFLLQNKVAAIKKYFCFEEAWARFLIILFYQLYTDVC